MVAEIEIGSRGPEISWSTGSVPTGTVTNRTWSIRHPALFARALLIEELEDVVRILANADGPIHENPVAGNVRVKTDSSMNGDLLVGQVFLQLKGGSGPIT
ncbi:MAG: hypothetical protein AB7S61_07390 [Methanoregulaceae archaeon]